YSVFVVGYSGYYVMYSKFSQQVAVYIFFFSSRRRHTRSTRDWSSDVCSSDLIVLNHVGALNEVGAQHAAPLQLGGGLLGDIRDGLLVDELIGVGQGNVTGGAFSHPVALAYRIERGAITGRVKDAAVAGNGYGLWKQGGG